MREGPSESGLVGTCCKAASFVAYGGGLIPRVKWEEAAAGAVALALQPLT
jgi:hypothetical protein